MFGYIAKKIFGTRNDRVIRAITPLIDRINELEASYEALSDEALRNKTAEFRERLARGETLEDLKAESFAAVREAAKRVLGMRHFDVQIIGGSILHTGRIAEMKTGEGKTLTATLPVYLNALPGKGVHVVTVNDYLAKRDSEWMGRVYNALGMSVGCIYSGLSSAQKRQAYNCDITYGQNNEFGFDYLRDNMKFSKDEQFQRGHYYAIVDEVDSILIDEARTPLIISGPAEDATDKYYAINKIIPFLIKDKDFEIELKSKNPALTEAGVLRCEELLKIENLYDPKNIELLHHVNQALKAHHTMMRDAEYVVKDGQIIIVDEFTGRLMPGRRWSDGLHQAIEAKEGLKIARENQTLASITFQNYFRMYDKLAGMTGTADTEAVEFKQIYNLEVIVIPPNRINIRDDQSDVVYRTRKEKYQAVVDDIATIHKTGQPILVGTINIDQSEALSRELSKLQIKHSVLNAKHHEKEAEIVAQAGRFGAVTISTNMAGRGTDILLGGNPEFLAAAESKTKDPLDPKFISAYEKFKTICAGEKEQVVAAGGLFIMGTERHESRRIDNQLRGRSGRQGDPGKTRFYISLEDDLMKRFGGDRIQAIMTRMGWEEGIAIDGNMISRSIETAQKRVEAYHFESRKHVTEYDDVMNKQRQVIYNLRNKVLANDAIDDEVRNMIQDQIEQVVLGVCDEKVKPIEWNLGLMQDRFAFLFNQPFSFPADMPLTREAIAEQLSDAALSAYTEKQADLKQKLRALADAAASAGAVQQGDPLSFETFQQHTILETVDHFWLIHLQDMDHLREGIGLRGYGQKNPLYEYQRDGFTHFQTMLEHMSEAVIRKIFFIEVASPDEVRAQLAEEKRRRAKQEEAMKLTHPEAE
jgi:preprotein translocase subunit SecA